MNSTSNTHSASQSSLKSENKADTQSFSNESQDKKQTKDKNTYRAPLEPPKSTEDSEKVNSADKNLMITKNTALSQSNTQNFKTDKKFSASKVKSPIPNQISILEEKSISININEEFSYSKTNETDSETGKPLPEGSEPQIVMNHDEFRKKSIEILQDIEKNKNQDLFSQKKNAISRLYPPSNLSSLSTPKSTPKSPCSQEYAATPQVDCYRSNPSPLLNLQPTANSSSPITCATTPILADSSTKTKYFIFKTPSPIPATPPLPILNAVNILSQVPLGSAGPSFPYVCVSPAHSIELRFVLPSIPLRWTLLVIPSPLKLPTISIPSPSSPPHPHNYQCT